MIILFTDKDIASKNIAENLMKLGFEKKVEGQGWQYSVVHEHFDEETTKKTSIDAVWRAKSITDMIDTKADSILEIPTNFDTDRGHLPSIWGIRFLVVLSPHKSKAGTKMLTCHVPGNWDKADFGGENRTLNIVYASKIKIMLNQMKKLAEEKLPDFEVAMEVDHHGPTCKVPILFVEIGSNEEAWQNKVAGEIIANAVIEAINDKSKWPVAFGIGGDHYAKPFRKIIFESNDVAIGHIIPKYHLKSLAEDTFKQAVEKSVEKVTKVIIIKDDLNLEQKKRVKELCEKFRLGCEET